MRKLRAANFTHQKIHLLGCMLAMPLCLCNAVHVQNTVGAILGTVTSSDGAPIGNASVTVTN